MFGLFMGEQGTGVVNDMWMAASQHHWLYSTELIVSSNTCTWQIQAFCPLFNCGRNQDVVCPSKQRSDGRALFWGFFFTQTYVYGKAHTPEFLLKKNPWQLVPLYQQHNVCNECKLGVIFFFSSCGMTRKKKNCWMNHKVQCTKHE